MIRGLVAVAIGLAGLAGAQQTVVVREGYHVVHPDGAVATVVSTEKGEKAGVKKQAVKKKHSMKGIKQGK